VQSKFHPTASAAFARVAGGRGFLGEYCVHLPHRCSRLMCLAANAEKAGALIASLASTRTRHVLVSARLCRTLNGCVVP